MFCFGNLDARKAAWWERLERHGAERLINIVTIFPAVGGREAGGGQVPQPQMLGISAAGCDCVRYRDGGRGADGEAAEPVRKNQNNPLIGSAGVGGADGGTRIEIKSGAGVGRTELPADARDTERGGDWLGVAAGVMLEVRAGDVGPFLFPEAALRLSATAGSAARTDAQHASGMSHKETFDE